MRLCRPHHIFEHRLPRDPVTQILGAVKTRAVHRHDRHAAFIAGGFTHGGNIVAGQGGHTGVVDKYGGGSITVHRLFDGMEQTFLAAPHDDILLGQISGHADAVQGWS